MGPCECRLLPPFFARETPTGVLALVVVLDLGCSRVSARLSALADFLARSPHDTEVEKGLPFHGAAAALAVRINPAFSLPPRAGRDCDFFPASRTPDSSAAIVAAPARVVGRPHAGYSASALCGSSGSFLLLPVSHFLLWRLPSPGVPYFGLPAEGQQQCQHVSICASGLRIPPAIRSANCLAGDCVCVSTGFIAFCVCVVWEGNAK